MDFAYLEILCCFVTLLQKQTKILFVIVTSVSVIICCTYKFEKTLCTVVRALLHQGHCSVVLKIPLPVQRITRR